MPGMVGCHVKENQEIGFTKEVHIAIYLYVLGTTTRLSKLFQVLGLWLLVHLKENSTSTLV